MPQDLDLLLALRRLEATLHEPAVRAGAPRRMAPGTPAFAVEPLAAGAWQMRFHQGTPTDPFDRTAL